MSLTFDGLSVSSNLRSVLIKIVGTGIWLCFTDNGADYALSVDGNERSAGATDATTSPACSNTGASSMLAVSGLGSGSHNVQLRVSAAVDKEFMFYGGTIEGSVTSKR